MRIALATETDARVEIDADRLIRGGEACVYPGTLDGEPVAVKVANHPLPDGGWLLDEASVLESLARDPSTRGHVVAVRGRGLWNGRPFLVEEWIGETLAQRLAAGADPGWRLTRVAELAEAVAALHARLPPVIHRDLKPSNVLLRAGRPVLADFGLAREARADATAHTVVPHTPGFSAPELRGPGPHRPSLDQDLYALAATAVFTLVGRAPTSSGGHVELERVGRVFGADLAVVLGRMLSEARSDRTATAAELATAARSARVVRGRDLRGLWILAAGGAVAGIALLRPVAVGDEPTIALPRPEYATVRVDVAGRMLEVGVAEVDQALWERAGGDPLERRREFRDGSVGPTCTRHYMLPIVGDDLPMVCVSLADVAEAANRLSRMWNLAPAYTVSLRTGVEAPDVTWDRGASGWRLPTDGEWLDLVRRAFPDGPPDRGPGACARVNIADRSLIAFFPTFAEKYRPADCDDGYPGPAPVASFLPDALGLYHLWGNVDEWVFEPRADGHYGICGGTFTSSVGDPILGNTGAVPAEDRRTFLGFRLVRDVR